MTNATFRRWALRGTASLSVVPAMLVLNVPRSTTAPELAAPFVAVTTSTTYARAFEVAMDPVTTTTTTPPPTPPPTVVTAPRVTAPPTTAKPRVVVAATPPLFVEQRGQQALALLNYPWERLGYRIEFQGPRTGLLGVTDSSTKLITVFVRDRHTVAQIARTLAHELGHALDFSQTTVYEAKQYLAIRGLPFDIADWYPCNACTDFSSPAGDFAETFASYLLGPGDFRSEIGPAPSADQLAALGAIFSPN